MFQLTCLLATRAGATELIIVLNQRFVSIVERQLGEISQEVPAWRLVVEPISRNTAPAIMAGILPEIDIHTLAGEALGGSDPPGVQVSSHRQGTCVGAQGGVPGDRRSLPGGADGCAGTNYPRKRKEFEDYDAHRPRNCADVQAAGRIATCNSAGGVVY